MLSILLPHDISERELYLNHTCWSVSWETAREEVEFTNHIIISENGARTSTSARGRGPELTFRTRGAPSYQRRL